MSNEDDHRWFIQEILPGGTLASTSSHSGHWNHDYSNLVIMQTGVGAFLFGQNNDDNYWFTALLDSEGILHSNPNLDEGHWEDYWPTIVPFRVGGRQYIFGHRKTWDGDGPWFIQHVTRDGYLGAETDSGEWHNYYATMTSFVGEDGETYLFGHNTNKHWFIQRVESGGKMGSETDNGDWDNYFEIAFPFSMDKSYWDTDNWMGNLNNRIGSRKLNQIALPGSHDAGMNEADRHDCLLGRSCNTVTQKTDIGGQLKMGSRYFDIRPVLDYESDSSGNWSTGHFQITGLGMLGCEGEDKDSIVNSLEKFFADSAHQNELVILKFSHCLIADRGENDFRCTKDQVNTLAKELALQIGDKLVKCDGCHLTEMTLDEILALGNIVLVFDFDPYPVDRARSKGIFKWGMTYDYYLKDDYSNTENYEFMKIDQISMLLKDVYHSYGGFLLSWTLTLSAEDATYCNNSILELSRNANPRLYEEMWKLVEEGQMTQSLIPNVLYVDAFDTFATRTAIYLNTEFENLGE